MNSTKSMRSRTPLMVEALERRLALDGNVAAGLQNGELIATGDADDNQIIVTQPNPGTVRIKGLEGTTVNGRRAVDFALGSGGLSIRMAQRGEDLVSIQGRFALGGDLNANLGAGEFLVEGSAGPVSIGGDLTVRAGKEGMVTVRNEVRVGGETSIEAGGDVTIIGAQATLPDFASARFDDSLTIDNPYFPAVVGAKYVYESEEVDEDTGEITHQRIVVEVLPRTKTILGVKTRVVRDRVYEEGVLIEDTFDWYAQDNDGNVWYLGENVTNFEFDDQGNPIGTNKHGSWKAGVGGSHAGIIMEAIPRVGHRYFQEFSPNNVMDYGEGLATDESAAVPLGMYSDVFRTLESSVMEPQSLANKLYAPGVGTIAEFDLDIEDDEVVQTTRLVSLTLNGVPVTQVVPTNGFSGVNASGRFVGGPEFSGETSIQSKGTMVINGATFEYELDAHAKMALIAVDSVMRGDTDLGTADSLSLKGVVAEVDIEVGGGLDDVHIFDSEIRKFKGLFGRVDNRLIVADSAFERFFADGGLGHNTFEDLGGNTFGELELIRFVEV